MTNITAVRKALFNIAMECNSFIRDMEMIGANSTDSLPYESLGMKKIAILKIGGPLDTKFFYQ